MRRSSSGRTGLNNCRTLRAVPVVKLDVEEEVDMTEKRFGLLEPLIKELRKTEVRFGTVGSSVEVLGEPAESANEKGFAENG